MTDFEKQPKTSFWAYIRSYRGRMIGALAGIVLSVLTILGAGLVIRSIVDKGLVDGDMAFLDHGLIYMVLLAALLAFGSFMRLNTVTWIGDRLANDIRNDVYARLLSLDGGFYDRNNTGELVARFASDTTFLQTVMSNILPQAVRNTMMLVGGLLILLFTSAKLTLFVLLIVPAVFIPILVIGRVVRKRSKATQDKLGELGASFSETFSGIRTVQSNTYEAPIMDRFGAQTYDAFLLARSHIQARSILSSLVIFIVFSAIAVILWVGGQDVVDGSISSGTLSAFVYYAIIVAGSAGGLSEVSGAIQQLRGVSERIFDMLNFTSDMEIAAKPKKLPKNIKGDLGFKEIEFAYPSDKKTKILENFSLDIPAGTSLAVVGPSGAGKSTLFSLVQRFYDPDSGIVSIDEYDLRTLSLRDLRRQVAIVPQDPFLFSGSIAENIRIARPEASFDDVRKAAKHAHADEFISKLSNQYETEVGEKGILLSTGQRQRIAIARAFLRDAKILLLDEATSALDSESEKAVQDAFDELMRGRTTLVIAHRLSTVTKADRIIVMEKGVVVEDGNHKSLIKNKEGLYSRLAQLQMIE